MQIRSRERIIAACTLLVAAVISVVGTPRTASASATSKVRVTLISVIVESDGDGLLGDVGELRFASDSLRLVDPSNPTFWGPGAAAYVRVGPKAPDDGGLGRFHMTDHGSYFMQSPHAGLNTGTVTAMGSKVKVGIVAREQDAFGISCHAEGWRLLDIPTGAGTAIKTITVADGCGAARAVSLSFQLRLERIP